MERACLGRADCPAMTEPVLLTAWIDFLCPWSWVATTRLERFAQEYGELVELEWRAFMRYPEKEEHDLDAWRASTKEWLEPAMAESELTFSLWATGHAPPTHSAPALVAALVAADVDPEKAARLLEGVVPRPLHREPHHLRYGHADRPRSSGRPRRRCLCHDLPGPVRRLRQAGHRRPQRGHQARHRRHAGGDRRR